MRSMMAVITMGKVSQVDVLIVVNDCIARPRYGFRFNHSLRQERVPMKSGVSYMRLFFLFIYRTVKANPWVMSSY